MKEIVEKIIQYQAMRDHSAKELIQKLSRKFPLDQIKPAIAYAIEYEYILEPQNLSVKVAAQLDRKLRGISYINGYLAKKGLPPVKPDWDNEFEKAKVVCEKKFKSEPPYPIEKKQIIFRYLAGRGFTGDVAKKVIYGKK